MPRKMRQLALKCVLSEKVRDSGLKVLEQLVLDQPKTREMMGVLEALKIDSSALLVTSEQEGNVVQAARNLPGVKALPANLLNVVDILSHKMVLMTVPAVRKAEELWGKKATKEERDGPVRSATPSGNN
jgi:large subunit ribosomal protein L4